MVGGALYIMAGLTVMGGLAAAVLVGSPGPALGGLLGGGAIALIAFAATPGRTD